MKITLVSSLVLSACVLTASARASGLTYWGMKKDGVGADGLLGAAAVAVSPDGANVYTVGEGDDAISVFERDPFSGQITYVEMEKNNVNGVLGLNSPSTVHVVNGGNHVYTGSTVDDAIAVFSRDVGNQGRLTFVEDVRNGDFVGCNTGAPVAGLGTIRTVTSDLAGLFVYAASYSTDSVVVFQRNAANGSLCYVETKKNGVGGVTGLNGVWGLSVSPDGGHLYAASYVEDSLAVFSIDGLSGALTFVTSYKNNVGGVLGLNGAKSVTVSWDGLNVYAGGWVDDSLVVFDRDPVTGLLTYVTRYKDGLGGVDGLNAIASVTMGTYDDHVYVASYGDNAVVSFARDPSTGLLSLEQVFKDNTGGVDGLARAQGIAAAWDGGDVYAVGHADNALVMFRVMP